MSLSRFRSLIRAKIGCYLIALETILLAKNLQSVFILLILKKIRHLISFQNPLLAIAWRFKSAHWYHLLLLEEDTETDL